jgi:tRNA(Arg) A34 adenosine deaminase TadA
MHKYLRMAARISIKGNWRRKAHIGCLAVRGDGTIVQSWNGCSTDVCPTAHAEARLARKLDAGSVVYVARVRRDNGKMAMSKPCAHCERILKNRGVKRIEYSINEHEFGILEF